VAYYQKLVVADIADGELQLADVVAEKKRYTEQS